MSARLGLLTCFVVLIAKKEEVYARPSQSGLPLMGRPSPLDSKDGEIGPWSDVGDLAAAAHSLIPSLGAQPTLQECSTVCASPVLQTLNMFFRRGNNSEIMHLACKEYMGAVDCIEGHPECGPHDFFDKITSGLKYMCIEQRYAFESVIGCVDRVASYVHTECNAECHPESIMTGLAVKDLFVKGFDAVDRILTPHMAEIVMSESCRIGHCLLKCFRTKLNARCDGSAGSLLAEAIARPLVADSALDTTFGGLFRALLPAQCSFVIDPKEISELRIDPQIDHDLKRLYTSKKTPPSPEQILVESIFNQPEEPAILDPFRQTPPKLAKGASPIDSQYAASHSSFREGEEGSGEYWSAKSASEARKRERFLREEERREWRRRMEEEKKEFAGEASGDDSEGSGIANDTTDGMTNSNSTQSPTDSSPFDNYDEETSSEDFSTENDDEKQSSIQGSGDAAVGELPSTKTAFKRHLDDVEFRTHDEGPLQLSPEMVSDLMGEATSASTASAWTDVPTTPFVPHKDLRVHYDGSNDEVTVLRLQRTGDNADLFVSSRVEPSKRYQVDVQVEPADKGELVCVLRTDKALAVNRIPKPRIEGNDDEFAALLADM